MSIPWVGVIASLNIRKDRMSVGIGYNAVIVTTIEPPPLARE